MEMDWNADNNITFLKLLDLLKILMLLLVSITICSTILLLGSTVSTYRILQFLILSVTIEPYMRQGAVYDLIQCVIV